MNDHKLRAAAHEVTRQAREDVDIMADREDAGMIRCEMCDGTGEWETECCNGAGGCSCRGERVPMGRCNVCGGTGVRDENADLRANIKTIQGMCFIGSGPRTGYWAGR